MTPLQQFVATCVVVAAYVGVGNLVYFTTVLPTLERAGRHSAPSLLPSGQAEQARAALAILRAAGRGGFASWWLRASPVTGAFVLLLILAMLARAALWGQ
jgi:hypothetical protein